MKNKTTDNNDLTGYIYVLSNSSIPGQLKIGKTTRHPEDRKKELSSATGVPTPFVLKFFSQFKNCHKAEKDIHSFLSNSGKKVSENKEFFRIELKEAIDIINKFSKIENNNLNNNTDIKKLIKEGFSYYNGNSYTVKNFFKSLEYFEQAAFFGSVEGEYMAGILSEKISETKHRKKDKLEWNQRALNHYNKSISLGNIDSYAKKSWLLRKLKQHEEANNSWNKFIELCLSRDHIEENNILWIIKWLDNKNNTKFILPKNENWNNHIKTLQSYCNNKNTPKGNAFKILKNNKKPSNYFYLFFICMIFLIILFFLNNKFEIIHI